MLKLNPKLSELAIALMLALLATGVLVTAYSYSRSSGIFPIFIGWIFVALTLLESAVHLKSVLGGEMRVAVASAKGYPAIGEGGILHELGGLLWLASFLAILYLAGFLIATPVFMFTFLRFAARRGAAQSLIVALATTALVYVVFAWLLNYRLFAGVLLGG